MAVNIQYTSNPFAVCPPPDPHPRPPMRFAMPPGAVDTHAHIIGPGPYVSPRSYTPPQATARQYLHMLDNTGIARGVLVQVSVHGTDNTLMLDFLRRHPARFRGVAVAPSDLPEHGWRELHDAGVRGLRLNSATPAGVGLSDLDRYEAICAELGWHLQFITKPADLTAIAPRLLELRVPAVIDHMGHFSVSDEGSGPTKNTILELVRNGAWVKLSGAFRLSSRADYADVAPFARELISAAPHRCLWGSDWPHVSYWRPMPNVGSLLDLLVDWAPDEHQRNRILVDNPARLYGFPPLG